MTAGALITHPHAHTISTLPLSHSPLLTASLKTNWNIVYSFVLGVLCIMPSPIFLKTFLEFNLHCRIQFIIGGCQGLVDRVWLTTKRMHTWIFRVMDCFVCSWSSKYTISCICQNPGNCTSQRAGFNVCELHEKSFPKALNLYGHNSAFKLFLLYCAPGNACSRSQASLHTYMPALSAHTRLHTCTLWL